MIGAAGFAFYKKDEIKAKIDEKRNVPEGSLVTDEAPKPHVFGRVAPALPINRPVSAFLDCCLRVGTALPSVPQQTFQFARKTKGQNKQGLNCSPRGCVCLPVNRATLGSSSRAQIDRR